MTSELSVVQAVTELRSTFAGEILQPTDPGYEAANMAKASFTPVRK
jgi:hypothetical protein